MTFVKDASFGCAQVRLRCRENGVKRRGSHAAEHTQERRFTARQKRTQGFGLAGKLGGKQDHHPGRLEFVSVAAQSVKLNRSHARHGVERRVEAAEGLRA
jgi:hypothetical protein